MELDQVGCLGMCNSFFLLIKLSFLFLSKHMFCSGVEPLYHPIVQTGLRQIKNKVNNNNREIIHSILLS